jgi:hypothetical protein
MQTTMSDSCSLNTAAEDNPDPEDVMSMAFLQNDIAQVEFEAAQDVPIEMTDEEKTEYSNKWRHVL